MSTTDKNAALNNSEAEISSFFKEEDLHPFADDYQNRFLKVFIENKNNFSETITDIVNIDFFDQYQKILLKYELDFYTEYKEIAKFAALKDIIREKEKDKTNWVHKEHLLGLVSKIETLKIENEDHVRNSAYKFFKERSVKLCLHEIVRDWQKHDYDGMMSKLESALKAGEPVNQGHDYAKDVGMRTKDNYRVPITLLPNLTDDGLAPGELAVIMAPTGAGKSMLAVAIAAYVYSCGGKVVYYTLELDKEVIGRRIDACLYNLNLWHVPDFHDIIEEEVKEFEEKGGRLVIQQYHRGKATVGTLAAHLKLLDFTPTLVVVDYGDELKPMIRRKDKIEELTDIYGDLKTFAQEAGVPLVSPSQVNRTAYGNEVFGLESTGGSMGKVNVADLVIIIGRPPSLKTEGKAVFTIAKDRNGTEKSIWATFNTKNVQIKTEGVEYIAKEKKEFKPYNNNGGNGNYKKKTSDNSNYDPSPLDFDEDSVNSWNNNAK